MWLKIWALKEKTKWKITKKNLSDKFSKSKRQTNKELSFIMDEDLYNAAKEGDIEKMKSALENGFPPNALLSIAAEVYFLFISFYSNNNEKWF